MLSPHLTLNICENTTVYIASIISGLIIVHEIPIYEPLYLSCISLMLNILIISQFFIMLFMNFIYLSPCRAICNLFAISFILALINVLMSLLYDLFSFSMMFSLPTLRLSYSFACCLCSSCMSSSHYLTPCDLQGYTDNLSIHFAFPS